MPIKFALFLFKYYTSHLRWGWLEILVGQISLTQPVFFFQGCYLDLCFNLTRRRKFLSMFTTTVGMEDMLDSTVDMLDISRYDELL